MDMLLPASREERRSRVLGALEALRNGKGIIVVDDEDRENEGDLIYAAQSVTEAQMAFMIRESSGIVCLCLPPEKVEALELPMMVENNSSRHQTAFTVSVDAAEGITTGVSAADRVKTIRTATAPDSRPSDLCRPGHIFPLRAKPGGVLERRGHTECTVDVMRLAGLQPYGILGEVTRVDGSMMRLPELIGFGKQHGLPLVTVEDICRYRSEEKL